MTKLLVVLGATGNQGSSVINAVQKHDPACKIRGITRNTLSAAAKALSEKGVEMVAARRTDQNALTSAFKGATAIFVVTDFWQPFLDAAAAPAPGFHSIEMIAKDDELAQGRAAVDAALTCLDTLEHFVFSSIPDEMAVSNGKYDLPHYAAKNATIKYIQDLQTQSHGGKTLWSVTSVVWVGYYMENWINHPYSRPKKSTDGIYTVRTPMPADTAVTITAISDIGRYVAAVLSSPTTFEHPILARSEKRTMAQMVASLAAATGKEIVYEQVSPAQFAKDNPPISIVVANMLAYKEEYGFSDDLKAIGAEDLGIEQDELTTFEVFVTANDWAFFISE
ncbi:MAG: hypothetical protein Q9166_006496 [cf. Caloplaca sp. 2 TL-2023]